MNPSAQTVSAVCSLIIACFSGYLNYLVALMTKKQEAAALSQNSQTKIIADSSDDMVQAIHSNTLAVQANRESYAVNARLIAEQSQQINELRKSIDVLSQWKADQTGQSR